MLGPLLFIGTISGLQLENCFVDNLTWDHGETNVVEFQVNIKSAVICQNYCLLHPSCHHFTWYSPESNIYSRLCVLYAHIPPNTFPCTDCVSGPKSCNQTSTTTTAPITTTQPVITTTTITTSSIPITTTTTATSTTVTRSTTVTTSTTTTRTPPPTTTDSNCNSDCRCQDWTYDHCHDHIPVTSLLVLTIDDCMENCKIFALENRCKFIRFLTTNEGENCLIYEDDFEQYVRGCHTHGQPLYQGENQIMSDCSTCNDCGANCISCQNTTCAGYAELECEFTNNPVLGSEQPSYEDCVASCKQEHGPTYAYYEGTDVKKCHCYSSGERSCGSIAVKLQAEDCIDAQ